MAEEKIVKWYNYFVREKILKVTPFFILFTLLCGLNYLTFQQVLRQSANDPQIQIAEDTAVNFSNDQIPIISNKINIDKSLSTFIIIFDKDGNVLVSSAVLNNKVPTLPDGVLQETNSKKEIRFTWQPENGVRISAVLVKADKGYVLAGRSLREIEKREDNLHYITLAVWIVGVVILLAKIFL